MPTPVPAARIISDYLAAWRAANGDEKTPEVAYENGWFVLRFRMNGRIAQRFRRLDMAGLTGKLKMRVKA
jgi:hypothetical protein